MRYPQLSVDYQSSAMLEAIQSESRRLRGLKKLGAVSIHHSELAGIKKAKLEALFTEPLADLGVFVGSQTSCRGREESWHPHI